MTRLGGEPAGGGAVAAALALGLSLMDRGRPGDALACFERALAGAPDDPGGWSNLGIALLELGRPAEAAARLERALALAPGDARTHLNLGAALLRLGRAAEAVPCFEGALALEPDYAKAHLNLGTARLDLGHLAGAAACFGQALALAPGLVEAALNLGVVRQREGRLEDAVAVWRRLAERRPGCFEAHLNVGTALLEQGELAAAMASLTRALALRPDSAAAHLTLGVLFRRQNRLAEAEDRFRRALALAPDAAEAHLNLGTALQEQGRLEEAQVSFGQAQRLQPELAAAGSAILFTRLYQPGTDLAAIAAGARDWADRHAAPLRTEWPAFDPQGRGVETYRLGFVSGDFRAHAVGFLVLPALEALARAGHRFYCYANQTEDDDLTRRFRAAAAVWRPVFGWSDPALAAQIRADGIDILVDLSGCTALNRLLVFARRPAPVQVAWVGYPATTGLEAMDYLLADPVQVPAGAEVHYREQVVRLPEGYVAYQPPEDTPAPGPLPAATTGFITFGSFNTLKKITPGVIEAWSEILRREPDARLLLKTSALDCRDCRQTVAARFATYGIAQERLSLEGGTTPGRHRQAIAGVDIALDSFPYSGGLTTLETLWLGVPVVTCPADTLCSRHTLGYLSGIGLSHLAARDVRQYVETATDLARDRARLSALRAGLRPRMAAAPLCDPDRFARHLEQAFATMWAGFRAGTPPRGFEVPALPRGP
jgi:predicted O-linked N-acetylglucosamine transferase (SPINDLY family)